MDAELDFQRIHKEFQSSAFHYLKSPVQLLGTRSPFHEDRVQLVIIWAKLEPADVDL